MEKTTENKLPKFDNPPKPPKERKARTITPESLSEQISRQPLESKVKLLAEIKASIEEDKKDLETKLNLINGKNSNP